MSRSLTLLVAADLIPPRAGLFDLGIVKMGEFGGEGSESNSVAGLRCMSFVNLVWVYREWGLENAFFLSFREQCIFNSVCSSSRLILHPEIFRQRYLSFGTTLLELICC